MQVADVVSDRSRCERAKVGAVIVDATNRPISTGYNGPPRGMDVTGDCSGWCDRAKNAGSGVQYGLACPSIHAEANALMFADRRDYDGGTIYVTASCCADCAKLIANSGIAHVVMRVSEEDAHRDPDAVVAFLRSCGIDVTIEEV